MIQVPRLEPKDLYDRRIRRDHARLRAYNQLLEQIYHKIYATSQLTGNTSSVLYTIPPFILGLPKIDMEDCVVYLVWQLRDAKFEVRFTWPNLLWISWKHHEAEYLARQNPIIQAMVPEAPPPPPTNTSEKGTKGKGKGGSKGGAGGAQPAASKPTVAFNEEINTIIGSPGGGASGAQFGVPPRSPGEYQPPNSFLQMMDRPVKEGAKGNVLADLWSLR